jgi:CBS domain-containing protein
MHGLIQSVDALLQDKVFDAVKKMAEANVGSILIMQSAKPHMSQVEGMITERDYLRKVVVTGKSSKEMACSALMTKAANIVTLHPDDTVVKVWTPFLPLSAATQCFPIVT